MLLALRNEERLNGAADAARAIGVETGGGAETLVLDATDPDAGERMLAAATEHFGTLDILVDNAGSAQWRDLDDVPDEDWRTQYELNVMAPLRAMRVAAPPMAERGWGRIVNVCSTAGKRPSAAMPEYSVAKAAELSLSRLFADRYAKSGVLVNALPRPGRFGDVDEPGGLLDQSQEMSGDASREEALATAGSKRPIGSPGRVGRDRRRDRLPLLRARLLRQRRGMVRGWRDGPGDHLSGRWRLIRRYDGKLAKPGRCRGPSAPLRLAGRARPRLHRAPRRPAAPCRRDLLPRWPTGSSRCRAQRDRPARG